MVLSLSKSYTPAANAVSNASSYNTDIAALFNAFSGLEAKTSTLGALVITPSANDTTLVRVNNAAGTELFSLDTTNSYMKIKATGRFYLDGGTETYIVESAADIFDVYVGGANIIKITESTADKVEILASDLEIDATQKFYLDAGGDTYIQESAADILDIYVGALNMIKLTEAATDKVEILGSDLEIDAAKIFYLDGGGNTYITEGSADFLQVVVGAVSRLELQNGGNIIFENATGYGLRIHNDGNNANRYGLEIWAGTDDNSGSNIHINLADGDGTMVGQVTSTGGTVTYAAFTGSHYGMLDNPKTDFAPGTLFIKTELVENPYIKKNPNCMQPWYKVEPSNKPNDPRSFGVYFSNIDDKTINIGALGDGYILVCSEGGDIKDGDYITSSNMEGHGMKQNDDLLHNYTVAKSLESVDWKKEKSNTKRLAATFHAS